jgi:hypothetical protein
VFKLVDQSAELMFSEAQILTTMHELRAEFHNYACANTEYEVQLPQKQEGKPYRV